METPHARTPLDGRRILIVEAEPGCALEVEAFLEGQGCRIMGPAPNCAEALALLEAETPDAVLLDLALDGDPPAPVAAALAKRRIPFVVVACDGPVEGDRKAYERAPWIDKPLDGRKVMLALICALNSRS